MVAPGLAFNSRTAINAVSAEGFTKSPFSSIKKQRSASPSNAKPISAFSFLTRFCRAFKFSGSIGFASWFGKFPSSSKYIGTKSIFNFSITAGAVNPAMPFPASITTFNLRFVKVFSGNLASK